VAGWWEGAVVGLGHGVSVGSNGPGGYGGAGWLRHAGAGEWREVAALWEVGGWEWGGNGGRVRWEVGSSAVREAGRPGTAGKVATSSRLGKQLGQTGGKGGWTK